MHFTPVEFTSPVKLLWFCRPTSIKIYARRRVVSCCICCNFRWHSKFSSKVAQKDALSERCFGMFRERERENLWTWAGFLSQGTKSDQEGAAFVWWREVWIGAWLTAEEETPLRTCTKPPVLVSVFWAVLQLISFSRSGRIKRQRGGYGGRSILKWPALPAYWISRSVVHQLCPEQKKSTPACQPCSSCCCCGMSICSMNGEWGD